MTPRIKSDGGMVSKETSSPCCGDDNGIHPNRTVSIVFHRNLSLAVGTEIGKRAVLADLCQLLGQLVGQKWAAA